MPPPLLPADRCNAPLGPRPSCRARLYLQKQVGRPAILINAVLRLDGRTQQLTQLRIKLSGNATLEGAGELLHREPAVTAAKARENVTSPGGTTAAALAVLKAPDGLEALMIKAAAAAHRRAGELAG